MTAQILDGIRIIDLSSGLAGPVATLLLAEQGADVIKVESPLGDPTRDDASFATWNRSKRSVVLDISGDGGLKKLETLLEGADVLLHDFTPLNAARLGLDGAVLSERFPSLVVCSVTGYPVNHPDAERPGNDLLVQARSGMMGEILGHRDGPIAFRMPLPSWAAAYLAASGIVTRLIVRQQTGHGGSVNTSLLQGMLQTASLFWNRAENPTSSLFSTKYDLQPLLAMYRCSDGVWLQIMNPGERIDIGALPFTQQAVADLKAAEEAGEPIGEVEGDVAADERAGILNAAILRRAFRRRTSAEWLQALRAADVAVEPALNLGEMFTLPAVQANDYVVEVEDQVWGRTIQSAAPFRTEPPSRVKSPAPALGEHTDEVLSEADRTSLGNTEMKDLPEHPLDGLNVLDLGSFLAGPMAPMLMADMGADVIKVEPVGGDRLRWNAGYWESCSRGKRALALNLHTEAGQEVLTRLIKWADIVHHNQRPKAAAKAGIDEAGLRAQNPDVVFSYVTSYGEKGDRAGWPGFDSVFEALGGWEIENGGEGNFPTFSRYGTLDVQTALASTVSTLLAQFHKLRTGVAGKTSGSLLGTTTMTQSETLLRLEDDTFAPHRRLTMDQTGTGFGERIYELTDGWIAVVADDDHKMAAFRGIAAADSDEHIENGLATQSTDKVLIALDEAGISAELVREGQMSEFFDDADNHASGLVAKYPHGAFGSMEQPGAFWQFGDMSLSLERAAPIIGQHSREILADLDYTEAEIDQLYADGVVTGPLIPPAWQV